jgi:hypothetical protein
LRFPSPVYRRRARDELGAMSEVRYYLIFIKIRSYLLAVRSKVPQGGLTMKKIIVSVFVLVLVLGFAKVNVFAEDTASAPKPDKQAMEAARQAMKQGVEKLKADRKTYLDARKSGDKNAIPAAQAAMKADQEQLQKTMKALMPARQPLTKEQIEKLKARRAELLEKSKVQRAEMLEKNKTNPPVRPIRPARPVRPMRTTSPEAGK